MIHTAKLYLGDVPVTVEYEHERAELETRDYPGSPESVSVTGVRIGEHLVDDVEIHFTDWRLRHWEEQILEDLVDNRQAQKDEAAIERYIDRQQRLLEPTFY